MFKNLPQLAIFIRSALVATVGFPILALNAFAQAPAASPAAGTAEVERVIVTGSLIPTAEEVGANPVFALNRDIINKSGQNTTTEQLLKSQPVMNASSVPVQNNGTSQAGPVGTASISLRGFDPGATLVLVDGRRVAPFPGVANSGYAFVDLLTIPVTAIQSIEILKDGASTTYGSDAVAGVVNIKLYKDYRGAEVNVQYGNTFDKDAAEYLGNVLFGVGDDKTSVTGDIFFYHHNSVFNHDRGNSIKPPFLSSNTSPYNLRLSNDVVAAAGGPDLNPGGQVWGTAPDLTNGLAPASDYIYNAGSRRVRGSGGLLPGYNFNFQSSSWPDQERWGGYGAFSHKICDDQLQVYGDFYYVDAKTHDELAPEATNNFETPRQLALYIPPNHPFALDANGNPITPPGTPTAAEVSMPVNAYNPFNPFQQIISGASRARLGDFGNRLYDNENIAERFTAGVKGDKLFGGNWGYDGAFVYSQLEQIGRFHGVNIARLDRIMNQNDPLFNPTSIEYIGQTTPYNPFNDQRVPIATNQPLLDFASTNSRDLYTEKYATLDLNIYTTDLFDLPGGPVGFAMGGSFMRETYTIDPDDQHRLGELFGVIAIPYVHAGRKIWALYSEITVPVFGPNMNIPGFHSLEFTAGDRFGEWRNTDDNAFVPKVGMRWQPFDEQLTLRATWGEGFLEPSMTDLYGPVRILLGPAHFAPTIVNGVLTGGCAPERIFGPCGSAGNPQQDTLEPETTIIQSPNQDLHPEHDRSFTAGFVYTPKWIPAEYGTLTLDFSIWDVERTGVVMFLPPSVIIAGYNAGRYPGTVLPESLPADQPSVLFDPTGEYVGVSSPYLNGGRIRANGADVDLQYQLETSIGTFTSITRVSYLNEFVFNFPHTRPYQVAGVANYDWYAGSFFGDVTTGDGWVKWKGLQNFDWTWHNFDLNATVHLLDGFWEILYSQQFDGFFKKHYVHPTWFTDAQFSYTLVFEAPVEQQPVAGYSKGKEVAGKGKEAPVPTAMPCWKTVLNNSTFTVGVNNIFGEDPPAAIGFEAGNAVGYPGSVYDNLGRFVYARLTKKF